MKYYYQVEGDLRNNIGDVLQGMVAKVFLPANCEVVDREALADMNSKEPGVFIANGWYMHSFDKFPPPDNINPVYVSVHIADSQLLKVKKARAHFLKHAPIGCRDTKTLQLFLGWGIPAYYSSCLTITCKTRVTDITQKNNEVLLVDNVDHPIPDNVKQKLESLFNTSLIRISHDPPVTNVDFDTYVTESEKHMDHLLKRYCEAKLIITTKIHCALPCLGMGANVLLVHPNPADPRLATVAEFIDILSYKQVLESDAISIPVVNQEALNKRRSFLQQIVSESVKKGYAVVSKDSQYDSIRKQARLKAKLYRFTVIAMHRLGLKKNQIQKVYGGGF